MPRKDHTHGFPSAMPAVSIEKSTAPFFEVRCYDVLVNGNDRVFGIPILIQENAAEASGNSYTIAAENVRYTLGVWNVTIGGRTFETIKCILLQNDSCEETYIDRNGQVVLLRQYEWSENLAENDYYSDNDRDAMQENAVIVYPYGRQNQRVCALTLRKNDRTIRKDSPVVSCVIRTSRKNHNRNDICP